MCAEPPAGGRKANFAKSVKAIILRVMSPMCSQVTSTAESVSYRKHNTLGTPIQLCMLRMLSMLRALLVAN